VFSSLLVSWFRIDHFARPNAVLPTLQLNMLGHDMSWAAFHVIEVMSQERFALKRVGYWACSQTFTPATDVIVLCTQLLKKEFSAKSPYEIGQAINCLANVATEDLARDLLGDVSTMLTSSRPYIRKKATVAMYKLYLQYPQGLRLTFDNLKRKLTDDDPSVVSCAVNVICELARKKPSNYLSIAPDLFNLLTSSSNNWMLIKVTKLMSALVQEEPRLARKLLEPLANIVQTTPAKSLMYECVSTITVALQFTKRPDGTDAKNAGAVVRLCTDKLREMVREPDQNLKYLGLSGLMSLMRSNPRVVAEHRELVLQCLMDEDVTIRLRALELITGMVTRRNLQDIVKRLLELVDTAEGHFRDELIEKIIFMCSRDKFAYLVDFAWYVSVLAKLAYIQGTKHSATIAGQLLDVSVRVEDMRPYAVQTLLPMLADSALAAAARSPVGTPATGNATDEVSAASAIVGSGDICSGHVLYAAAWIVGEYCSVIPPSVHSAVLDALLQPGTLALPAAVQSVYIQAALKILAAAASASVKHGDAADASSPFVVLAASALERLNPFAQSIHVEVQERACLVQRLLASFGVPFTPLPTSMSQAAAKAKEEEDLMNLAGAPAEKAASPSKASLAPLDADVRLIAAVLSSLFVEPLKPVNPKAQKKVPIPAGLDLDHWIRPEEERAQAEESTVKTGFRYESISFEDSYGIAEDEEEHTSVPRRGGRGTGADSEDEAWFADMVKKNKKKDKLLFGDNTPKPKHEEKASKKDKGDSGERRDKSHPFYLKNDGRDRTGTDDIDVDSIPIKELGKNDLKGSLDISMFGDFGKKKSGTKKAGKSKRRGSDSEEDKPVARSRVILDDDDMPSGAKASDDEEATDKVVDALASVDLSTPLRDDETLPTRAHRAVAGPAGGTSTRGKGRARHLAGEPSSAPAEEEHKKKKDKKDNLEGDDSKKKKKDKEDKGEEQKKSRKSKKEAATVEAVPAPASVTALRQGEEYATAGPFSFALSGDKTVVVSYTVASAITSAGGAAAAVTFKVDPKSSKKTVDYVDLTFLSAAPVQLAGVIPGAAEGSLRLADHLKEKSKGKSRSKHATVTIAVLDPAVTSTIPVRVTYLVSGSSSPVALDGNLVLRSASVLIPTVIEAEAYRALMTTEGAAFQHAMGIIPVVGDTSSEESINGICSVLRTFAVAKTAKHAILYARTASGAHVTALLKHDDSSRGISVTIKSVLPGHAVVLLEDITSALAAHAEKATAEE
jgi:AP-3 complex subunit delta-1